MFTLANQTFDWRDMRTITSMRIGPKQIVSVANFWKTKTNHSKQNANCETLARPNRDINNRMIPNERKNNLLQSHPPPKHV